MFVVSTQSLENDNSSVWKLRDILLKQPPLKTWRLAFKNGILMFALIMGQQKLVRKLRDKTHYFGAADVLNCVILSLI